MREVYLDYNGSTPLDPRVAEVMVPVLTERVGNAASYELSVRLIMRHKVAISRQAIAKHIDVLEKAGLVRSEKRGKYRMLVFNDEPIKTVMNRWLK